MIYDLIIVGMGPAGVSAAIYAKRAGLNVLCFDGKMIGGNLNYIDRIDNYPGLYNVSGPLFAKKLYDSIKDLDITFINKKVDKVIQGDIKRVVVGQDEYLCKKVIIATGRVPKKLALDNIKKLEGHGVSYCALCDGMFFKNKDVAVVGGGNSALQESLYLANLCNKVYLIHRNSTFRADKELVDAVLKKNNIIRIMESNVIKIEEDINGNLRKVVTDKNEELTVNGLFTYIGFEPVTNFAIDLGICDLNGYIEVNENCESKLDGIYGIGDIIKKSVYQITTGVSEGTIAATHIINKLNGKQ